MAHQSKDTTLGVLSARPAKPQVFERLLLQEAVQAPQAMRASQADSGYHRAPFQQPRSLPLPSSLSHETTPSIWDPSSPSPSSLSPSSSPPPSSSPADDCSSPKRAPASPPAPSNAPASPVEANSMSDHEHRDCISASEDYVNGTCRGGFWCSSGDIHLDERDRLSASCLVSPGVYRKSTLDFTECLKSVNGNLRWVRGGEEGNFHHRAMNVRHARGGEILAANPLDYEGAWVASRIWLDEGITNSGGKLEFVQLSVEMLACAPIGRERA